MEYMVEDESPSEEGKILCCECGRPIAPNTANMCVACLRTRVDITEGIPKQVSIYFCKGCERYFQPPTNWVRCTLESRELLAICLKKLKGLSKVNLVDASFVWTEPHSKRIKVKLVIQKEVMGGGTILQQTFIVEYIVQGQMCTDCHRVEAKDFWKAVVQLRQKVTHKKTFFYLEQMILKHGIHRNTLNIKQHENGLDFFFAQMDHARKMTDFFMNMVPCKYKTAKELVAHDIHSNTYNYKNTFSVEIVPINKDTVVCLPKKLAGQMGNMSQLCVCIRVTSVLQFIDPNTLQLCDITAQTYWRTPFDAVADHKHLTEYTVLQVERIEVSRKLGAGHGTISKKHLLADVWVMRTQDMGVVDQQYHCRSHLGHLLNAGDTVLGFDVATSNVNNNHMEMMRQDTLPDVVLVKKVFGDRKKRNKKRKWKLKTLTKEGEAMETEGAERDYMGFLEDLEEDPDYRKNVNIYIDHSKMLPVEVSESGDDEAPQISLQEMMDDLNISDGEEVEGAVSEGDVAAHTAGTA